MPRNTAISKAQLKNIIKITIGDKKKRKRRRRKNTRKRQADAQMDLITSLASKPSMRAVEPTKDDANDRAQNKLITGSLVATNAGILQALNNLNTPAYSGGFAPDNPFVAPEIPEDPNAPPETPAGKYAEKVRRDREFLKQNIALIPFNKMYSEEEIDNMAPNFVVRLATMTRNRGGGSGGGLSYDS